MKSLNLLLIGLLWLAFAGCEKSDSSNTFQTNNVSVNASGAPATGTGGSMARFTIVGNYLYAVDHTGLNVIDISNPINVKIVNRVELGLEIETIFPFKDKLFIGSAFAVHIVDITDPSAPKKLSEAIQSNIIRRCDPVVARDSVAYATLRSTSPCGGSGSILAVYDVKDVLHPKNVFSVGVGEPFGLGYSGNNLYVCDNVGLLVFDITKAYQPVLLRTITGKKPIDVIPYGNVLITWTRTSVVLYDITNRTNPVEIREIL